MSNDEHDWDHDHIVDLDFTGDPVLDQQGYQSPVDKGNRTGFHPGEHVDWLADAKADRARRRAKQAERRRREPPPAVERPVETRQALPQPEPPVTVRGAQQPPGQHGAFFERRLVRVWWAPSARSWSTSR